MPSPNNTHNKALRILVKDSIGDADDSCSLRRTDDTAGGIASDADINLSDDAGLPPIDSLCISTDELLRIRPIGLDTLLMRYGKYAEKHGLQTLNFLTLLTYIESRYYSSSNLKQMRIISMCVDTRELFSKIGVMVSVQYVNPLLGEHPSSSAIKSSIAYYPGELFDIDITTQFGKWALRRKLESILYLNEQLRGFLPIACSNCIAALPKKIQEPASRCSSIRDWCLTIFSTPNIHKKKSVLRFFEREAEAHANHGDQKSSLSRRTQEKTTNKFPVFRTLANFEQAIRKLHYRALAHCTSHYLPTSILPLFLTCNQYFTDLISQYHRELSNSPENQDFMLTLCPKHALYVFVLDDTSEPLLSSSTYSTILEGIPSNGSGSRKPFESSVGFAPFDSNSIDSAFQIADHLIIPAEGSTEQKYQRSEAPTIPVSLRRIPVAAIVNAPLLSAAKCEPVESINPSHSTFLNDSALDSGLNETRPLINKPSVSMPISIGSETSVPEICLRADAFFRNIQPTWDSLQRREVAYQFVHGLTREKTGLVVIPSGPLNLRTFLPRSALDLFVLFPSTLGVSDANTRAVAQSKVRAAFDTLFSTLRTFTRNIEQIKYPSDYPYSPIHTFSRNSYLRNIYVNDAAAIHNALAEVCPLLYKGHPTQALKRQAAIMKYASRQLRKWHSLLRQEFGSLGNTMQPIADEKDKMEIMDATHLQGRSVHSSPSDVHFQLDEDNSLSPHELNMTIPTQIVHEAYKSAWAGARLHSAQIVRSDAILRSAKEPRTGHWKHQEEHPQTPIFGPVTPLQLNLQFANKSLRDVHSLLSCNDSLHSENEGGSHCEEKDTSTWHRERSWNVPPWATISDTTLVPVEHIRLWNTQVNVPVQPVDRFKSRVLETTDGRSSIPVISCTVNGVSVNILPLHPDFDYIQPKSVITHPCPLHPSHPICCSKEPYYSASMGSLSCLLRGDTTAVLVRDREKCAFEVQCHKLDAVRIFPDVKLEALRKELQSNDEDAMYSYCVHITCKPTTNPSSQVFHNATVLLYSWFLGQSWDSILQSSSKNITDGKINIPSDSLSAPIFADNVLDEFFSTDEADGENRRPFVTRWVVNSLFLSFFLEIDKIRHWKELSSASDSGVTVPTWYPLGGTFSHPLQVLLSLCQFLLRTDWSKYVASPFHGGILPRNSDQFHAADKILKELNHLAMKESKSVKELEKSFQTSDSGTTSLSPEYLNILRNFQNITAPMESTCTKDDLGHFPLFLRAVPSKAHKPGEEAVHSLSLSHTVPLILFPQIVELMKVTKPQDYPCPSPTTSSCNCGAVSSSSPSLHDTAHVASSALHSLVVIDPLCPSRNLLCNWSSNELKRFSDSVQSLHDVLLLHFSNESNVWSDDIKYPTSKGHQSVSDLAKKIGRGSLLLNPTQTDFPISASPSIGANTANGSLHGCASATACVQKNETGGCDSWCPRNVDTMRSSALKPPPIAQYDVDTKGIISTDVHSTSYCPNTTKPNLPVAHKLTQSCNEDEVRRILGVNLRRCIGMPPAASFLHPMPPVPYPVPRILTVPHEYETTVCSEMSFRGDVEMEGDVGSKTVTPHGADNLAPPCFNSLRFLESPPNNFEDPNPQSAPFATYMPPSVTTICHPGLNLQKQLTCALSYRNFSPDSIAGLLFLVLSVIGPMPQNRLSDALKFLPRFLSNAYSFAQEFPRFAHELIGDLSEFAHTRSISVLPSLSRTTHFKRNMNCRSSISHAGFPLKNALVFPSDVNFFPSSFISGISSARKTSTIIKEQKHKQSLLNEKKTASKQISLPGNPIYPNEVLPSTIVVTSPSSPFLIMGADQGPHTFVAAAGTACLYPAIWIHYNLLRVLTSFQNAADNLAQFLFSFFSQYDPTFCSNNSEVNADLISTLSGNSTKTIMNPDNEGDACSLTAHQLRDFLLEGNMSPLKRYTSKFAIKESFLLLFDYIHSSLWLSSLERFIGKTSLLPQRVKTALLPYPPRFLTAFPASGTRQCGFLMRFDTHISIGSMHFRDKLEKRDEASSDNTSRGQLRRNKTNSDYAPSIYTNSAAAASTHIPRNNGSNNSGANPQIDATRKKPWQMRGNGTHKMFPILPTPPGPTSYYSAPSNSSVIPHPVMFHAQATPLYFPPVLQTQPVYLTQAHIAMPSPFPLPTMQHHTQTPAVPQQSGAAYCSTVVPEYVPMQYSTGEYVYAAAPAPNIYYTSVSPQHPHVIIYPPM